MEVSVNITYLRTQICCHRIGHVSNGYYKMSSINTVKLSKSLVFYISKSSLFTLSKS